MMNDYRPEVADVSDTIPRVSEHAMKRSFETTPSDAALRSEDGWIDMDVRWLLTRDTVGAEHSVFGITVFPPGSKHDIHRHPNAEEFEYLVSGRGIARVCGAAPRQSYHRREPRGQPGLHDRLYERGLHRTSPSPKCAAE